MSLDIKVISFGYKYHDMPDANVVFDMRFLDNPARQTKEHPEFEFETGLDEDVAEYVFNTEGAEEFYQNFLNTLKPTLPLRLAQDEIRHIDRSDFTIAFGCTGGQHRSVAFAERLAKDLKTLGYDVSTEHRNMEESKLNALNGGNTFHDGQH
jgi:UPF0042 nucleotide-binding protein